MNYSEVKQIFRERKRTSPREDLTAHIIFTEDSFRKPYSLLSRTYSISSDNKAFWPNMGGYSIFGYCLDKTSDQGVRLDYYMAEERDPGGWRVEDCYILEQMRDTAVIPSLTRMEQDDGTVCYFFGDTCIRVRESHEDGKIRLEPMAGDQTACGEWVELPIDRVYGYCIVDYLQIVAPSVISGRVLDTKTSIDHIVHTLKAMQSKHSLTVLAISSLNRQNYLTPIDFESFKESGGIEYTADVIWGLQLSILEDEKFFHHFDNAGKRKGETTIAEKRKMIQAAKGCNPREIDLVCLKNRFGRSSYSVPFQYFPASDYFRPPYDPNDPDTWV